MKPSVKVRFITSGSFVSRAIRWTTNSLWSHVEFGTPEGTWIGAHIKDGIQERPSDYCKPSREFIYEIPCTQAQSDALLKWARAQIGIKYNSLNILGLLLKNRHWTTPNRFICSQFCTVGLLKVFSAYEVLNVLEDYAYLITPEMLHLSPIFVGRQIKRIDTRHC